MLYFQTSSVSGASRHITNMTTNELMIASASSGFCPYVTTVMPVIETFSFDVV